MLSKTQDFGDLSLKTGWTDWMLCLCNVLGGYSLPVWILQFACGTVGETSVFGILLTGEAIVWSLVIMAWIALSLDTAVCIVSTLIN